MITELWQIWEAADFVPFLSAGLDSPLTTLTFSRSILGPLCCQQVSRSDMRWTQLSAFDVLCPGSVTHHATVRLLQCSCHLVTCNYMYVSAKTPQCCQSWFHTKTQDSCKGIEYNDSTKSFTFSVFNHIFKKKHDMIWYIITFKVLLIFSPVNYHTQPTGMVPTWFHLGHQWLSLVDDFSVLSFLVSTNDWIWCVSIPLLSSKRQTR